VRPAVELVHRRVVHARVPPPDRIGNAVRRHAPHHLETVGTRVGPEVVIERAVLLDDEDQVVELEDPLGGLVVGVR
jgi:hypothetical protein